MKKWAFFLACFGVVAALSGEGLAGQDVATLEPVQTVYIALEDKKIVLQTDTGAEGSGESVAFAIENLHETTAARVFLDTADYLLVESKLQQWIPSFQDLLRPSCRICLVQGDPDMEQVGAFLKIHKPKIAMKDYLAGDRKLPTLKSGEEGMLLVP